MEGPDCDNSEDNRIIVSPPSSGIRSPTSLKNLEDGPEEFDISRRMLLRALAATNGRNSYRSYVRAIRPGRFITRCMEIKIYYVLEYG